MTCAFGNFVKFCGPVPFGPLGRCPYNTSFRHHILCFLGFKNPWIGGVGCFPPRRKNGKIPGGHSKNRVFQTAKIRQFSTAKIAVDFRQTGAQTNDFPTCPQQGLDAATKKVLGRGANQRTQGGSLRLSARRGRVALGNAQWRRMAAPGGASQSLHNRQVTGDIPGREPYYEGALCTALRLGGASAHGRRAGAKPPQGASSTAQSDQAVARAAMEPGLHKQAAETHTRVCGTVSWFPRARFLYIVSALEPAQLSKSCNEPGYQETTDHEHHQTERHKRRFPDG